MALCSVLLALAMRRPSTLIPQLSATSLDFHPHFGTDPPISPGEICAASKFLLGRNLARPTGKNGQNQSGFSIFPTGLTPVGLMISGHIGPPGGYSMPCMKYPG